MSHISQGVENFKLFNFNFLLLMRIKKTICSKLHNLQHQKKKVLNFPLTTFKVSGALEAVSGAEEGAGGEEASDSGAKAEAGAGAGEENSGKERRAGEGEGEKEKGEEGAAGEGDKGEEG